MFNKNFIWGTATAATQIEGAAYQDGKEKSIWDVYSERGDVILHGHTIENADDSYNRMDEDIELIKNLGVNAYRFSISWPRIINANGEINEKGLEHYSQFVDKLLAIGVKPFITLFHWELPYYEYQKGGWLNREISKDFKRYVEAVSAKLAAKVDYFITINEPQCIIGHYYGGTDKNRKYTTKEWNNMVHNLLLCHGEAVKVLRQYKNVKIGFAPCGNPRIPATNSKEDIDAARESYFDTFAGDAIGVSIYSDPICLGDYPKKYYEVNKKEDLADIQEGDLELISQPIDFYCQNIYQGTYIKSDGKGGWEEVPPKCGTPITTMGWFYTPESLYWGAKFLYERYHLPFYISENGCAVTDTLTEDKKVHDVARSTYLKQYISELDRAYKDGIDVRGYFVWSLMDNFEWYQGYTQRFGIVYVNFDTYERIPKDSYYTYRDIIKDNK